MRLYTKTGDCGESSLINGKKLEKSSCIFDVLGLLDELSSVLGLVKAADTNKVFYEFIEEIQIKLMKLMAGVAAEDMSNKISDKEIEILENEIDRLFDEKDFSFVLPGKSELSARLDFARTVARNAERAMVCAKKEFKICPSYFKYINRLSDYLYAAARYTDFNL